MGCGENEGSTLRSALLVPRSYFPSTLLVRISLECLSPPSSSHQLQGVPRFSSLSLSARCRRHSLPLPPRQFLLFVWLAAAKRKDTKRKRAELARSPLIPFYISLSCSFSFSFLVCRSRALLHRHPLLLLSLPLLFLALAAARWFVNAKFKLSRATLLHEPLCDANEGTNTSTLSKSPCEPPPPLQTPKRAYQ